MADFRPQGFSEQFIDDVVKQVGDITETYIPLVVLPSAKTTAKIFSHAEITLRQTDQEGYEKKPKSIITDVAHVLFTLENNKVQL